MNGSNFGRIPALLIWSNMWKRSSRILAKNIKLILYRHLCGRVCGVFGFGGVGVATARLMRAMGMQIHAINRRGYSAAPTEWIGTPAHLDMLLRAADVFVIAAPLSHATVGCIGAREFSLMKEDAILVNLARGEIIDEGALFAHLQGHPAFTACLDAWWVEPIRHGVFRMQYPFMELPNVIGSPHNSASVGGGHHVALQRAAENCRRALTRGQPPCFIGPVERMVGRVWAQRLSAKDGLCSPQAAAGISPILLHLY